MGAAFFKDANLTNRDQQWQFFPVDSEFYVLRTNYSGPNGVLGTGLSDAGDMTVPSIYRANFTDDSVYWRVLPVVDDDTFTLSNKQNKSEWHLNRRKNSLAMMTNITVGDEAFQRFSFKSISAIDDMDFSTVRQCSWV